MVCMRGSQSVCITPGCADEEAIVVPVLISLCCEKCGAHKVFLCMQIQLVSVNGALTQLVQLGAFVCFCTASVCHLMLHTIKFDFVCCRHDCTVYWFITVHWGVLG